jgi:hypothetical protein
MTWVVQSLLGPGIWAAGFAGTYALHGLGCARGWPELHWPELHWPELQGAIGGTAGFSLHLLALTGAWIATLALGALVLAALPTGDGRGGLADRLPRVGAWTGLVASVVTLAPVVLTSSC